MVDILGRRYVLRPVLFNTLLARIVSQADTLLNNFKQLKVLSDERDAKTMIVGSASLIRNSLDILLTLTTDAETVFFRNVKEMDEVYDDLKESVKHSIRMLEAQQEKDEAEIKRLKKQLKHLDDEKKGEVQEDEKKLEEHDELLKKEIENEQAYAGKLEADLKALVSMVKHVALEDDFSAKYHEKSANNPEAAIHEFSLRTTVVLLRKIKWDGIETRQLHNRIKKLLGEMKEFSVIVKDEPQIVEYEIKMLMDMGTIVTRENIVVHRILHSFLHRMDAVVRSQPQLPNDVKSEVEHTRLYAQNILSEIRNQTKKFRNEFV